MNRVLTKHLQFESIMAHPQKLPRKQSAQRGITLLESLIALLILALGVLGLAAVQARMLVETRTTNSRATAIRLIADLSDRVRINKVGAQPPTVGGLSPYSDTGPTAFSGAPAAAPASCGGPCTPDAQKDQDLYEWRTMVGNALMGGQANIWQTSPQQLQVTIAWKRNENATDSLASPLQVTSSYLGTICSDASENNFICHVDFIDIPIAQ